MKALMGILLFVLSLSTFAAGQSMTDLKAGKGICDNAVNVDQHLMSEFGIDINDSGASDVIIQEEGSVAR